MSSERERKYQLITDAYTRKKCMEYQLGIPSEIVAIIFMFYFIKVFDIEYGEEVQVQDNILTNIGTESPWGFALALDTSVIGNWMVPESDNGHVYTIKVKIIRVQSEIGIGIVREGYTMSNCIVWPTHYTYVNDGEYYDGWSEKGTADKYGAGDIVSLTLNLQSSSLSYDIVNDTDDTSEHGILFKEGEIDKVKYKWAVGMYNEDDCVEIIDVYSNN